MITSFIVLLYLWETLSTIVQRSSHNCGIAVVQKANETLFSTENDTFQKD